MEDEKIIDYLVSNILFDKLKNFSFYKKNNNYA